MKGNSSKQNGEVSGYGSRWTIKDDNLTNFLLCSICMIPVKRDVCFIPTDLFQLCATMDRWTWSQQWNASTWENSIRSKSVQMFTLWSAVLTGIGKWFCPSFFLLLCRRGVMLEHGDLESPWIIFNFNFKSMEGMGGDTLCPAARIKVRWSNDHQDLNSFNI